MAFTDGDSWGGRPIARSLADAGHRQRVQVTGTVTSAATRRSHGVASLVCELSDGTGCVDLLFLGRPTVPGLTAGVRCTVEGTARREQSRLVVWNPIYQLHQR